MPINLAKAGYSHDQVKKMLHMAIGSQQIRFRFDLLDKQDNFLKTLDTVTGGKIEHSAHSDIKRTATFDVQEEKRKEWITRPRKLSEFPEKLRDW